MAVPLNTVTMANAPTFHTQSFTNFNITLSLTIAKRRRSTFDKSHIRDQTSAIVLIGQIWPDDIIEDVISESVNRERQSSKPLWPDTGKSSSIHDEAGDVIEVRMSNEIRIN
jgi:hypothetical protein